MALFDTNSFELFLAGDENTVRTVRRVSVAAEEFIVGRLNAINRARAPRTSLSFVRIGAQDCRIAAQALAYGLTVITRNVRDFTAISAPCADWVCNKTGAVCVSIHGWQHRWHLSTAPSP